jgi:hypothetical protein
MFRRRRFAALAAIAALSLAACANGDAKRSEVVDAMTDAGLSEEQAECVGDRFEAEFDQEQMNELGGADQPDQYPRGTEDQVEAILDECIRGEEAAGEGTTDADTTDETIEDTADDTTDDTTDEG